MQSLNVKSSAVNQLNVDELEGIAQVEFKNAESIHTLMLLKMQFVSYCLTQALIIPSVVGLIVTY